MVLSFNPIFDSMRSLISGVLFFLITAAFYSCKQEQAVKVVVPEVSVVQAGQKTVPMYAEYVGQTFGQSDIEIQPRVEGWITGIHFKEGDAVKEGQLLYTIDDIQLRNRVSSAEARVTETEVLLTKAKSDLDRVEPLAKMNALSQRDLDAAKANYEAQVQSVASAKSLLANAQVELGYSRITAPINGVIGVSRVQVGDYVTKGAGATPINTVSAVGAVRVRFSISENDYLTYRKKAEQGATTATIEVEMILSNGEVFPEKGKIDFADRTVDPTTGSLLVQAIFENKNGLLKPGQYGKVRFKTDEVPNAILVPQQAVNQLQNIFQVFLVDDSNRIVPKPVKTGFRIGSNWVITDGLKAGDRVALLGNAVVKPKMVVQPVAKEWSYEEGVTN